MLKVRPVGQIQLLMRLSADTTILNNIIIVFDYLVALLELKRLGAL